MLLTIKKIKIIFCVLHLLKYKMQILNMEYSKSDIKAEIEYTDMKNEDLSGEDKVMPQFYDPDVKADKNAIPDIEKLTSNVLELLDDLETPEYKMLAEKSYGTILNKLYEKYDDEVVGEDGTKIPNPKYIPYKLINILSDNSRTSEEKHDDVLNMLEMLNRLEKVKKNGADINEQFELFREGLKERHIYPKFGGKNNFEKVVNGKDKTSDTADTHVKRHKRTKKTFRKNNNS